MKTNKVKQVCGRCGGSGNYSFNLKDGTICYGCNGAGFVMVDPVKEEKKRIAREAKQAERQAKSAACSAAWQATIAELNPIYGPFDVTTALGVDQLNCRVYRVTGKNLATHRDERMAVAV